MAITGEPALAHAEEAALVERAVEKRRREFATGRALAHALLTGLGAPDGPLLPGPRRAPGWPTGFVGSISHTRAACAVAVAPAAHVTLLGLDLEDDADLPERVAPRVLLPSERRALEALPQAARGRRARLVFSAKECLYKALAPVVDRVLAFGEIEIVFPDGGPIGADGSFMSRFVRPEGRPDGCPEALEGRWVARQGALLTVIAAERSNG